MECFLLELLEDGEKLPQASAPQNIKLTEPNTYTSLIQSKIDLAKNTRSVKKTLTIPAWLNKRALDANINFSSLLQDALVKELKIV